jgi:glycosyltransferase involved in cell wall biosynthesis
MVSRLLQSENYKGHRNDQAWPRVLARCPRQSSGSRATGTCDGTSNGRCEPESRDPHPILGWVSEERKHELLTRCRCLACRAATRDSGSYLEAMWLGRPCLVSHMDAGVEVVNPPEADWPPTSPARKAWRRRLSALGDGPEWAAWSDVLGWRLRTHFTAERFHERLIASSPRSSCAASPGF